MAFDPNHNAVGWNLPVLSVSAVSDRTQMWSRVANTGATLVRCDAYWASLQPTNPLSLDAGKNDTLNTAALANLDAFFDDATVYKCKVWLNVAYTPTWARPGYNSLPGYVTWGQVDHIPPLRNPDDNLPDYANFCYLLAARYATRNPGVLVAMGLWNEPNLRQFWMQPPGTGMATSDYSPDPYMYGKLVAGAYDAVKTGVVVGRPQRPGHPEIFVIAGGMGPGASARSASNPIITTSSLSAGTLSVAYSATVVGAQGTTPYSWAATNLHTGLSINSATGVISGVPTQSGSRTVTVTLTDALNRIVSHDFTLAVAIPPSPSITLTNLVDATSGSAYSMTVTASGGTAPYTWSATGLPSGLSINTSTGIISGTTTVVGTSTVVITVTDSLSQTANKTYSLVVNSAHNRFFASTSPWNTPTPSNTVWYDWQGLHTFNDGSGYRQWFVETRYGLYWGDSTDSTQVQWTFNLPAFGQGDDWGPDHQGWHRVRNAMNGLVMYGPVNMHPRPSDDLIITLIDRSSGDYVEVWLGGGMGEWVATTDYWPYQCVAVTNAGVTKYYVCIQASGPASAVKAPASNPTYWKLVFDPVAHVVNGSPNGTWAVGNIWTGTGVGDINTNLNAGVRVSNFTWAAGLIQADELFKGKIDHALHIGAPVAGFDRNLAPTTITAAITATATSIPVADLSKIPATPCIIEMANWGEQMKVTAVTGTSGAGWLTVQRGYGGTGKTAYASGTQVRALIANKMDWVRGGNGWADGSHPVGAYISPATGGNGGWPTGSLPLGTKIGIPASVPKPVTVGANEDPGPGQLSYIGGLIWDALQTYGGFLGDGCGPPWPQFYCDGEALNISETASIDNTPMVQLVAHWGHPKPNNPSQSISYCDMDVIGPQLRVADFQPTWNQYTGG